FLHILVASTETWRFPMEQTHQIAPLSVSVEDAARIVGYSRSGVYELIAAGDLKAFKIGRRRLILMTELKAWVERAAKVGAR
uniref:helix-turn-helix domain-containing protein n=2 Tax=Pseudomonas TaxID=286 RepID=UPI003BF967BB